MMWIEMATEPLCGVVKCRKTKAWLHKVQKSATPNMGSQPLKDMQRASSTLNVLNNIATFLGFSKDQRPLTQV